MGNIPPNPRSDSRYPDQHIRSTRFRPKGHPMPLEAGLLEILACPACHAPLKEQDAELICTGQDCGLAYPVRDGIPVLLVDEARRPA
ncbi:hypothetical protein GCM10017776_36920 [Streptomyces griseoluteus]|nr:hypothetical protein GCM10017776_36920 [Streptomyces griseoluteus]